MTTLVRMCAGTAVALVLGGASPTGAAAATVARSVVGSGATSASGSGRQLQGTAGQAVVGASAAAAHVAMHGFWTIGTPLTTAVDPPGDALSPSVAIEFGAPRPNPSHGELAFTVGLPQAGTVSLLVADVQGRVVSPAASWPLAAGQHRVVFNPAPDVELAPGIYFARLVVDGRVEGVRRFVQVR